MEFTHSPLAAFTPTNHEIRLLTILTSTDQTSPISCKLQHANLLSTPPPVFRALSYVWGDPSITLPIIVHGQPYHVTANCYAALLRLREVDGFLLWVDAICINQKDDLEKVTQIRLMKDIYFQAQIVIIWLGKSGDERMDADEENERLAFSLIEDLASEPGALQERDPESFVRIGMRGENPQGRWKALSELLTHKWFERLWVYQERVLGKEALALTQYHAKDYKQIALGTAFVGQFFEKYPSTRMPFLQDDVEARRNIMIGALNIYERERAWFYYDRERKQMKNTTLLQTMNSTRRFKCYDPRDRVFGILALLDNETVENIQPDYASPIADLYARLALAEILQSHSLEVLTKAGLQYTDVNLDSFPSWVMDWRRKIGIPLGFCYRMYQADGKGGLARMLTPPNTRTLSLEGCQADRVLKYLDPKDILRDRHIDEVYYHGLTLWKEHFCKYPTGCEPYEAWLRTINSDLDLRGACKRLDNERIMLYKMLARIHNPREEDRAELARIMDMDEEIRNDYLSNETFEFTRGVKGTMDGRHFFITENGYMGVGPLQLQEGDLVCILFGCNVPLLIRKVDDYHVLVGACFVLGLMDGEALELRDPNAEMDAFHLR